LSETPELIMSWNPRIHDALSAVHHSLDPDVVEELAQHARAIYDAARADGASPAEAFARVDAQIAIWQTEASELGRRPRRAVPPEPPPAAPSRLVGLVHDVRYAARLIARRPGAALVSVLTMALGIGATTALFSVAWGVLVKPLPWPDADRLVRLSETRQGSTRRLPALFTNDTYHAWRESPATIEDVALYSARTVTLTGLGDAERIRITAVTPNMFPLLRVRPVLGAPFAERSDSADETKVVLAFGLWQQRFAGAADVLGRTIQLDGQSLTVAAVMPRGFSFPDTSTRAWVPMRVPPQSGSNSPGRSISMSSGIARLKPGRTAAQAAEEATARGRTAPDPGLTAIAVFGSRGPVEVSAVPLLEAMTTDVRDALLTFMAAVGLLLVTATANVASVQLARSATRRREMAIRSALGAGGRRLVRQLLVENVILGVVAGGLGLAAALALVRVLPALLPPDFPRVSDIVIDFQMMVFALTISVLTSLGFGLLPALLARRIDLVRSLSEDGLAPVGGRLRSTTTRTRAIIMAGQVAIASILLIGASLLMRSFSALIAADRGYDTSNVLTARLPMPRSSYSAERRRAAIDQILARLHATPGVVQAAVTSVMPLGPGDAMVAFTLPSSDGSGEPAQVQAGQRIVSPEYFQALGMRIREGRSLAETDTATSLPVVVVNRAFAQRYLGSNALGRRLPAAFEQGSDDWEVVGIVDDVRMRSAIDPPQPEVFVSYAQLNRRLAGVDPMIVVRTSGDPGAFIPQLRDLVAEQDRALALEGVVTMEQRLLDSLARPRLYAALLGVFAICAVTIAAVGLFGVLSCSVAQRSREIAVRSALGARPRRIVALVVRQGLLVTLIGLAAGVLMSFVLASSISTLLYGVSVHDPLTFACVPLAIAAVAAVACFVPARRAARLDPLRVLRGDT
jgi:putative ABC transport system permease protein